MCRVEKTLKITKTKNHTKKRMEDDIEIVYKRATINKKRRDYYNIIESNVDPMKLEEDTLVGLSLAHFVFRLNVVASVLCV